MEFSHDPTRFEISSHPSVNLKPSLYFGRVYLQPNVSQPLVPDQPEIS